jgi:fatty-acid peroxygenase
MPDIPRDRTFDATLAMLTDPYRFISKRSRRLGSDVFRTRVMFRSAVCVVGEDASRMFYEPNRFTRRGAVPPTALMLLQDFGSAQVLDGVAHRHRKQMLMSLMTRPRLEALVASIDRAWRTEAAQWTAAREIVVAYAVPRVLTRGVCDWVGIPLAERDVYPRTRELVAMYEGAGAIGPRNWKGQILRARTERWARALIDRARSGELAVPEDAPIAVIASHRELDGKLLDRRHAAVELINLLRPTVAVERWITWAALALHEHPEARGRIRAGDDSQYVEYFAQEVRRFYPFFPLVGGRALSDFEWRGNRFAKGTWMLLDMYGTNHDARAWPQPDEFRPERFAQWNQSPFNFIPQGGGDFVANHRCAGDRATVEIVKRAVRFLAAEMDYDVPPQDLSIDMSRMPAMPRSGVRIANPRLIA